MSTLSASTYRDCLIEHPSAVLVARGRPCQTGMLFDGIFIGQPPANIERKPKLFLNLALLASEDITVLPLEAIWAELALGFALTLGNSIDVKWQRVWRYRRKPA